MTVDSGVSNNGKVRAILLDHILDCKPSIARSRDSIGVLNKLDDKLGQLLDCWVLVDDALRDALTRFLGRRII